MCFKYALSIMPGGLLTTTSTWSTRQLFLWDPTSDFRIMLEFNREMQLDLQKLILQLTLLKSHNRMDFQAL